MPKANPSCDGCVQTFHSLDRHRLSPAAFGQQLLAGSLWLAVCGWQFVAGTTLSPCYYKVFITPYCRRFPVCLSPKMRTLALIVACIGIGYGIAVSQFQKRTANIKNIMGSAEDMDEAIQKAKTSNQKPGKIEVIGGPDLDFGTMRLGTKRSHNFVFKNIGETPVEVVYKSATCKCTVGKLDATTLKAGEQTQVELEWLAEGSMTDFAQTATISTSAIDQEEIKLTITGKIGQAHVFDPPMADFRDFLAAVESEQKGRLYSFEESPLEITTAKWSDLPQVSKVVCELKSPKKLAVGEIPEYSDARYYLDFVIYLNRGLPAGAWQCAES